MKKIFVCCHYLQINRLFEMKPLIKSPDLVAYNRLICRKLVKFSSLGDDYSKVCLIGSCRALFLENVIPGELLDITLVSVLYLPESFCNYCFDNAICL